MEFVSEGHEDERRVISIVFENTVGLILDPLDPGIVPTLSKVTRPEREFRLEIDSLEIRGLKTRLGGAVGVEAHMVESPLLNDAEDVTPSLDIHRRVPGERKGTPFMGSPQEDGDVVQFQCGAVVCNLPESKWGHFCVDIVITATEFHIKDLNLGMKLAPRGKSRDLVEFHQSMTTRRIPSDRCVDLHGRMGSCGDLSD